VFVRKYLVPIGIFCCMILAWFTAPGEASAAGLAAMSVAVSSSTISPGSQFTVSINVNPNNAVAGMQFSFSYDSSLITVYSVDEGTLLKQSGASTYFNEGQTSNSAGTVTRVWGVISSPSRTVSVAGTFATISMKAGTKTGTSALTLTGVVVSDVSGQSVPVTVTSGQVTVGQASSPTPTTGAGGSSASGTAAPAASVPAGGASASGGGGGGGGGFSGGGGFGGGGGAPPPRDVMPPEISAVAFKDLTRTGATIDWNTNEVSSSQVVYWAASENVTAADETLVTAHSVTLTELLPVTEYQFKVRSHDRANNVAESGNFTFTTPGKPASFILSNLKTDADKVKVNEPLTGSVMATNAGEVRGDYLLNVTISSGNDSEVIRKFLTVEPGLSQEASFSITRALPGAYQVKVEGMTRSFTVLRATAPVPQIAYFLVSPSQADQTHPGSASISYGVFNDADAATHVSLVMSVLMDGQFLEEVSLFSGKLEGSGTAGIADYVPPSGWANGTYGFRCQLKSGDAVVATVAQQTLDVQVPRPATVRWYVLGMIIGILGMVAAVTTIVLMMRRAQFFEEWTDH
jgi:hypothetical protein